MAKQEFKLKDKAIAAYEASNLRQQDITRNEGAAHCIREVLRQLGIETEVASDVFETEGIRFYADRFEDEAGIYAYAVDASCECPDCKRRIMKKVAVFKFDLNSKDSRALRMLASRSSANGYLGHTFASSKLTKKKGDRASIKALSKI
jgi:hypothetical protein